jgi:hypothetical protein
MPIQYDFKNFLKPDSTKENFKIKFGNKIERIF